MTDRERAMKFLDWVESEIGVQNPGHIQLTALEIQTLLSVIREQMAALECSKDIIHAYFCASEIDHADACKGATKCIASTTANLAALGIDPVELPNQDGKVVKVIL